MVIMTGQAQTLVVSMVVIYGHCDRTLGHNDWVIDKNKFSW
jgi:hypothetical protein